MTKLENTFSNLLGYLVDTNKIDAEMLSLHLVRSPEHDAKNRKDPRAFCAVSRGSEKVLFADALNYIPEIFQVAILLHEIGHHVVDGFASEENEVDVDVWIFKKVPEAHYDYKACQYAYPPKTSGFGVTEGSNVRVALNLQWVAPEFCQRIRGA